MSRAVLLRRPDGLDLVLDHLKASRILHYMELQRRLRGLVDRETFDKALDTLESHRVISIRNNVVHYHGD